MLPRRPAVPARRRPVSPSLRQWLQAPGSLTARLRRHGAVSVEVMRQGRCVLWPQEQAVLGSREGHVREVILWLQGRPAVWARSATPLRAVKGPWREIKGLGTRPLAELLFLHRSVRRDALVADHWHPAAPARRHLLRQWREASPGTMDPDMATFFAPAWARRSVFWHHGQPLQVLESFAPWMAPLPAGPRRGRAPTRPLPPTHVNRGPHGRV